MNLLLLVTVKDRISLYSQVFKFINIGSAITILLMAFEIDIKLNFFLFFLFLAREKTNGRTRAEITTRKVMDADDAVL